jgi:uncharacterized protein (DUF302 family)
MNDIGMKKKLSVTFDQALVLIPEALKPEGFGILTEIDVQGTLKKKLDVDFRRYRILGACNPTLAHKALSHALGIGVMLPCNVVVYEGDDGLAVVETINPEKTIAALGMPELTELAATVKEKLTRMLAALPG